ncbi:MAG: DinB family protein [Chloroflexota bacterium]
MSDPQTKPEIIERLREIQHGLSATVQPIPSAHFDHGTADAWAPANYLKHMLLAIKPFAKAITFPPDALRRRFGTSDRPSLTYAELVARYQARLDQGIRAEDFESVMPTTFRIPDGTADLQSYLLDLWNEAHDRMIDGLGQWSEADLDAGAILHPALATITVREMLFFTLYHNALHWNDIRLAVAAQDAL